jgi:hypothetical protein
VQHCPIRPAGLTGLQMHLGDGCTFGLVSMGGGRTYGFAYVVQPRFRDPLEGRLDRLRDRFAKFGSRVQEYLSSLGRDDQVICSAMACTSESCRRKPSSISWGQPSTKNDTLMARCRFGIGRHHRLRRSGDASENSVTFF